MMRTEPDPALRMLWLLTAVRVVGIAIAMLGLWIAARLPMGPESRWIALPVLLAGAAVVIFAPRLFGRHR